MATRPLTIPDYLQGRDKAYPGEWLPEYEKGAIILLARVNKLLTNYPFYPGVRSGWRPKAVNDKCGGSPKSWHLCGKAVDLNDSLGNLCKWIMAYPKRLVTYDLYMEMPDKTPTWCHLQCEPPRTGMRVFWP